MTLAGRAALITGGKRIGAAVARALAAAGMDVALSYNSSQSRSRSNRRRDHRGRPPRPHRPGRPRQSRRMPRARGRRRCRVRPARRARQHGVGLSSPFRSIRPTSTSGTRPWTSTCAPRFSARARPFLTCAATAVAASSISRTGWRRAGARDTPDYLPYYVAKGGAKALTEALALELAPDQILVNAVAPGPIMAPPGTTDEESQGRRGRHAARPLGRRRSRSPAPSCS